MTAEENEPLIEARDKIAVAAGAALLVAGLVLVTFVLPAEYGLDPRDQALDSDCWRPALWPED
jgi:hypothetical protein